MTTVLSQSERGVDKAAFWSSFLRAVGNETRSARLIRGASGIEHPVIATGVDEGRRRVVVVSQEFDARAAALALADIQYAHPDFRFLLARPVALNLGEAARRMTEVTGSNQVDAKNFPSLFSEQSPLVEAIRPLAESATRLFESVDLNVVGQILQIVQQLGLMKVSDQEPGKPGGALSFSLDRLAQHDPSEKDGQYGICSLPLYDLTPTDIQSITGIDVEAAIDALRRAHIIQYFFPAPDQLVLGLAERGSCKGGDLSSGLTLAPELGHPLGPNEVIPTATDVERVVEALSGQGLMVEGEFGYELTPAGKTVRASLKFKPREGLISKLLNRISVTLNLKDLFGGRTGP